MSLAETVTHLECQVAAARAVGDEAAAESALGGGLKLVLEVVDKATAERGGESLVKVRESAVRLALRCGEVTLARKQLAEAVAASPWVAQTEEWTQFFDVGAWTDEWLIAAVRREPPDPAALDALARRYWKEIFGRCYLLTLNQDKASDLAQQAWARVLRTRARLLPGGNFLAYLTTVATNLWRDSQRWARRAGPIAEQNLVSLDQPWSADDGDTVVLADALPCLNSPDSSKRTLLRMDIDQALQRLSAKERDVLVARYIAGESCADIATRYGRTEQAVSGWVREAIRHMKAHLEEPTAAATPVD